jgi:hypothetical protein
MFDGMGRLQLAEVELAQRDTTFWKNSGFLCFLGAEVGRALIANEFAD